MSQLLQLLNGGAGNLAAYLAAHVLLCLLPAFFIAGAMAALIPKASITRWLGRSTPAHVSYPAAAAAGSLLAVCSCTIVPLFAGIYRKGAGLGPAITFLFFAPAGNIMALAYTGSILGADFALARIVLCLVFGIGIGMLMALLFWRDDARHDAQTDALFAQRASIGAPATGVLLALVVLLVAGTLKVPLLTSTVATTSLPIAAAETWQAALFHWVPFDASRGEEGGERAGLVADRTAGADRPDRLEGPGGHHRRRQPLDLGLPRPRGPHAAGRLRCRSCRAPEFWTSR
ncbi:MAG: permease [Burkholderiaceae bacterium]